MEINILAKLKSKYIFQNIFDYIKYKNYKYLLFIYSKLLQNKLDIELDDYKIRFMDKMNLNICQNYMRIEINNKEEFDRNYLKKNIEADLIKYDDIFNIKTLQKYIIYYFKNKSFIYPNILCIYSPFFDILLNNCDLEQFYISIEVSTIKKFNLEDDYISAFNNLNNLNKDYPKIEFEYKDGKDVDYFQKLHLNKIKKLTLLKEYSEEQFNYEYFFKNLFLLPNILKNLIVLEMESNGFIDNYVLIDGNSFKYVNNLNLLKELSLNYIIFENIFCLKLYNLKILNLNKSENISFDSNNPFNLKILKIEMGIVNKSQKLTIFPVLEECNLIRNYNYIQEEYDKIIDFKSLYLIYILKGKI